MVGDCHFLSAGCLTLGLDDRLKPAWVDSPLSIWDSGMKKTHVCISTPVQRQQAFGWESAHDDYLELGMCRKLCEDGRIVDAVDALNLLVQRGWHVPNNLFYRFVNRCKDLVMGRRIHSLTVLCGYKGDAFLATHLIAMYASHGRLDEAMRVFTDVSAPDAYNWATIIFAYARHGEAGEAIRLYRKMRESATVKASSRVYVAVLKACAGAGDVVAGKEVHSHILASPGNADIFVQTGLVDMYAKCGCLEDARMLFDKLPERDVVTWNVMLTGYAQQGMGQEVLGLYNTMQQEGRTLPNSVTYVCLLQACASVGGGALCQGKQLHAEIQELGQESDMVLGCSLVNMYAKCGSLGDAGSVFDMLPARNVVTWTAMIAGCVQQGMGEEALRLYSIMQLEGLTAPDDVAFVCLLQACAIVGAGALEHGKQLHEQIGEQRLRDDETVAGSLINMYSKCSSVTDARSVFDKLHTRNVVTWAAMIAGYAEQGMGKEALMLYSSMQQEGITHPNSVTFVCLLQACATVGAKALHQGKQLHADINGLGLQDDMVIGGCLVNMYVKCGSLEQARIIFDRLPERDVVTWTALIAGYVHQGMGEEALNHYTSMQHEGITAPNSVTFVCLLQACAIVGVGALHQGRQLHAQIEGRGLQHDVILGGSLVNMYAKGSSLEDARSVFDRLLTRNVVTWTAMIAGYAQHGLGQEALTLYSRMLKEGLTPDSIAFVCLLQACTIVSAIPLGKQLHTQIEERGLQADPDVGAGLVNMYAKFGSMAESQQVFDSLPERSIEAWNAIIGGYTRHGGSQVVFDLVHRMRLEGIQPDGITFLGVLTVCSHVGLVDKGEEYFEAMRTDYGISPNVEHYICIMDLLGRAGHLEKALAIAKSMPFPANTSVWHTLLAACHKWTNVEIGQQAFEFAVGVDDKDAASFVMMSNIYARAQMWEEAREMQERRKILGAWKKPGQSWWTDMGGVVHTFGVGAKMHPESEGI